MKIYVDRNLCENHGQCTIACPENFRLNDEGILEYTAEFKEELRDKVQEAIDVCPTQAISLVDD